MTALQLEKSTYYKHLLYSSIDGAVKGAFILNQFLFIKSLNGSEFQLGVLFQVSMVVFLLAVLFNGLVKRFRDKGKLIRVTALATRLPLLLIAFFPTSSELPVPPIYHYFFLGIFFIFYLSQPIILPILNLILKQNYSDNNFGRYFGHATTANKSVMLVITFSFGIWLDHDPMAFVYLYPGLGVLSIISFFLISTVPFENIEATISLSFWGGVKESFSSFKSILTNNIPFRQLEIGFMLYGLAWMSTEAVITIFYGTVLDLNYSSVSFYKNVYNILAILLLPFFGRLIGRVDPRRFGIICFGSLLMYLLFTLLTQYFPYYYTLPFQEIKIYYVLMIAAGFNGLFMATMPLLWGIGSAYFCSKDEVGEYQSVHLTLVGARAVVFPIVGILFLESLGFTTTYLIGIVSLLAAIGTMIISLKRHRLK